ncbi:polysaccharide deacetylase family protein [Lunatibacter salilacus]|uniref:polysaccharide deacetylase family protein n=1 Tax=Lunatibacter salilacus TaxID=2483804 RepID=UPI00131BC4D5|nr:polysaccharide deacetylase family protein [Lunatibacter salilacus]
MFLYRVPTLVQWIYPRYVWHMDRSEPKVYLTFDDGPVDGITDFVLDLLLERNMKATFFMVGDNILKYLPLARRIVSEGHQVGNHTFNHLNGWNTSPEKYLENVAQCQRTIEDHLGVNTDLFRPPYGRMSQLQRKHLCKEYRIVMWEILSGDFITGKNVAGTLKKISKKTQNGSIILFHDQQKTAKFVKRILPGYLDFLEKMDFKSDLL